MTKRTEPAPKGTHISVYIDDAYADELRAAANLSGKSLSEYVCLLIEQHIIDAAQKSLAANDG